MDPSRPVITSILCIITRIWTKSPFIDTAWKVFVFGVILVRIFPHLDWIPRDTSYLSVFSSNAGKCWPEQLGIRTLFTLCTSSLISQYGLLKLGVSICKSDCTRRLKLQFLNFSISFLYNVIYTSLYIWFCVMQ